MKSLLSRIWLVGLVLLALGGVLIAIGLGANRPALTAIGYIGLVIGGIAQFVGWVLALLATARVARWGWFASLLVLGLFGFQFFVMIAYLVWGPEERAAPGALPA